jgi:hypothetical protein
MAVLVSRCSPIIRDCVRSVTTTEDGSPKHLESLSVRMPAHMHKHQHQRLEAQHNRRIAIATEQTRRIDLDQYYETQRKRIQIDAIPLTPRVLLSNTSAWQRIVLLISLLFLGWCVGTAAVSCSIQPSNPVLPALSQVPSARDVWVTCSVSALDKRPVDLFGRRCESTGARADRRT